MNETLSELKTLYQDKTLCNRIRTEIYFRISDLQKQIALQNAVNNDVGVDYV
jgi:hypothetical protein